MERPYIIDAIFTGVDMAVPELFIAFGGEMCLMEYMNITKDGVPEESCDEAPFDGNNMTCTCAGCTPFCFQHTYDFKYKIYGQEEETRILSRGSCK